MLLGVLVCNSDWTQTSNISEQGMMLMSICDVDDVISDLSATPPVLEYVSYFLFEFVLLKYQCDIYYFFLLTYHYSLYFN